jgi:hypothetical protein
MDVAFMGIRCGCRFHNRGVVVLLGRFKRIFDGGLNMAAIRRRFIERDYVKSIEMKNKHYITESEIDKSLDEMDAQFDDLTFIFTPFSTGWKTKIIDNNTESEITIDEIGKFAEDFYIRQLIDLTKQKYGLIKTA